MLAQGNPWSFYEYDYLYKHYNTDGAEACAKELGRSVSSVESKASKLGLLPQGTFKQFELNYASTYGKSLGGAMIFLLPYRTSYEVEELIACKHRRS